MKFNDYITFFIIIVIILFSLSCTNTYRIANLNEMGTLDPIPIRVIENNQTGDFDISISSTKNNLNEINFHNGKIELPNYIYDFDFDFKTDNINLFAGFQTFPNYNLFDNTFYLGFGLSHKWKNWGIRADFFNYKHKRYYEVEIIKNENESDNNNEKDTLIYVRNQYYNNILPSFTINSYELNLIFNISKAPYFKNVFKSNTLEGWNTNSLDDIEISRRHRAILTLAYYKELKKITIVLGASKYQKNTELFKYFIQLNMHINKLFNKNSY